MAFSYRRQLQPKIIVESCVYRGSSLFTFRQAAAPEAKITAFDVSFANLLSRLEGVDYREHDWGLDNIRAALRTFAFSMTTSTTA
jgi:hypothetical protein